MGRWLGGKWMGGWMDGWVSGEMDDGKMDIGWVSRW